MRWFCAALVLAAALPAFAADDNEAPPTLLSPDEARDRNLTRHAQHEAFAATCLLSTSGMLALQSLATFIPVMLSIGGEPACVAPTCHIDNTQYQMARMAVPALIGMSFAGLALSLPGAILAGYARAHERRANRWLTSASSLTVRF